MSIDPTFFALGPLFVRWSTLFAVLALAASAYTASRMAKFEGLKDSITAATILVVAGGVTTGRAFVLFEHPELLRRGFGIFFLVSQGGVPIFGALPGALAGLGIYSVVFHSPFKTVLGVAGPAMLIGVAISSIGSLVDGNYAGTAASSALGIAYSQADSSVAPTLVGRPIFPSALLLSLACSITFGGIRAGWSFLSSTERLMFSLFGLSLVSFLLGFLRLDPVWILGLRYEQAFALILLIVTGSWLMFAGRRFRTVPVIRLPG